MTYELEFSVQALKEWEKLNSTVREQFKNKLRERLNRPRVPKDKLSGQKDCYKNMQNTTNCVKSTQRRLTHEIFQS